MAKRITFARSGAGRKPENVDMDTIRELLDEWGDNPLEVGGLSDGVVYGSRGEAQKVAQGYKTYLENHYGQDVEVNGKIVRTFRGVKISAITSQLDPDEAAHAEMLAEAEAQNGFAFSLNPRNPGETDSTGTAPVQPEEQPAEVPAEA